MEVDHLFEMLTLILDSALSDFLQNGSVLSFHKPAWKQVENHHSALISAVNEQLRKMHTVLPFKHPGTKRLKATDRAQLSVGACPPEHTPVPLAFSL